jgi:hypothetical protein
VQKQFNVSGFKFPPGMSIDTEICTVGNERYSFGDCIQALAQKFKLELKIEDLRSEIEVLNAAREGCDCDCDCE